MALKQYESERTVILDDDNRVTKVVYKRQRPRPQKKGLKGFKEAMNNAMGGKNKRESMLIGFAFYVVAIIFLEVVLHLLAFGAVTGRIIYPMLFALPTAGILTLLSTFFSPKTNGWIFLILTFVLVLYFEIQLVYYSIFGDFVSISQFGMGGEAIENFWRQMLYGIWQAILKILLLMVPFFAAIACKALKLFSFPKLRWTVKGVGVMATGLLHVVCLLCLLIGGKESYTAYDCYYNPNTGTNSSIENLGVITTGRIEVKYLMFGSDDILPPETIIDIGNEEDLIGDVVETDRSPNIMDIDFNALAEKDKGTKYEELDEYFASQTASNKNEYTGYFKDYNLIALCAESFSSKLISKEITPTLYKLSTEGFVFNNFYNSYASNTTNGEYTFCMGIFPDLSRSKADGSFEASHDNWLPFCLGNMFSTAGVQGYAYHNYYGSYYSRKLSHPNMGYIFKTPGAGLKIRVSWPSSDLEMMQKSVDDYLTADHQFLAYYMTFSGHYQYNWGNPMCKKNRNRINKLLEEHGLNYDETVKAYLACNLELEDALTYLLERLEEAGVAEKTVIVLTNDHYPYGLNADQFNQLAGYEVDTTFEKYKNSFICWNGGMEKPVVVNTPCCSIDILPTVLNLFGFEFDSRLLMGRDVFAENVLHVAILSNQSWITDKVKFNARRNKYTLIDENVPVNEDYINNIKSIVKNKFTISTKILNTDYYGHVVPKYNQE